MSGNFDPGRGESGRERGGRREGWGDGSHARVRNPRSRIARQKMSNIRKKIIISPKLSQYIWFRAVYVNLVAFEKC